MHTSVQTIAHDFELGIGHSPSTGQKAQKTLKGLSIRDLKSSGLVWFRFGIDDYDRDCVEFVR
jgi:hypothetical protein